MKQADLTDFVRAILAGTPGSGKQRPKPEKLRAFLITEAGRRLLLEHESVPLDQNQRKRLEHLLDLLADDPGSEPLPGVADLVERQARGGARTHQAFEDHLLTLEVPSGRTLEQRLRPLLRPLSLVRRVAARARNPWLAVAAQINVATTDLGTLCLMQLREDRAGAVTLWRRDGQDGALDISAATARKEIRAGTGWSEAVAREVYDWLFDIASDRRWLLTGTVIDARDEDRLLVRRPRADELIHVRRAAADPYLRWTEGDAIPELEPAEDEREMEAGRTLLDALGRSERIERIRKTVPAAPPLPLAA